MFRAGALLRLTAAVPEVALLLPFAKAGPVCVSCRASAGAKRRRRAAAAGRGMDALHSAAHPWRRESVLVPSSDGVRLSVEVFPPAPPAGPLPPPGAAVVLVHQYSLLGGCQALMRGLALELNARHIRARERPRTPKRACPAPFHSCITFDMRGVGKSTGRSTVTGHKEIEDVAAVCRWAVLRYGCRLLLLGSSAGAPVAGSALDMVDEVFAFVAIGYTFGRWAAILFGRHFRAVLQSRKPRLFVMGTADGFTSVAQLRGRLREAEGGPCEEHLVEGRGHFELEGPAFDADMAAVVANFMQRLAQREGSGRDF